MTKRKKIHYKSFPKRMILQPEFMIVYSLRYCINVSSNSYLEWIKYAYDNWIEFSERTKIECSCIIRREIKLNSANVMFDIEKWSDFYEFSMYN